MVEANMVKAVYDKAKERDDQVQGSDDKASVKDDQVKVRDKCKCKRCQGKGLN